MAEIIETTATVVEVEEVQKKNVFHKIGGAVGGTFNKAGDFIQRHNVGAKVVGAAAAAGTALYVGYKLARNEEIPDEIIDVVADNADTIADAVSENVPAAVEVAGEVVETVI